MGRSKDDAKRTMNDQLSEQETVARREAALKRMLSTPHKPHKLTEAKRKDRRKTKKGEK